MAGRTIAEAVSHWPHTVATRRPLVLNGWGEEFKHEIEDLVKTEFSEIHLATASLSKGQAKDGCLKISNSNHTKCGNTSPTTQLN